MYEDLFPNVSYIVVPSRNDGKDKGNKSARPRHHIYFPHEPITVAEECAGIEEDTGMNSSLMIMHLMQQGLFLVIHQQILFGMKELGRLWIF